MKSRLQSQAAIGLGTIMLALSGCSSSAPEPASSPALQDLAPVPAEAASAPLDLGDWRLKYVARCPSTPDERCNGAYGFSVDREGGYEIGPGPGGQVLMGSVTDEERKAIEGLLMASPAKEPRMTCSGNGDKSPSCSPELEEALKRLARKYYPETFPSPCIDAMLSLQRAYDPIRRCQEDSDCDYLDADFAPVDPRRPDEMAADDCGYVPPLRVASGFLAVVHQLELILKRDLARKVCGKDHDRPGCDRQTASVSAPKGPPVCDHGMCRSSK